MSTGLAYVTFVEVALACALEVAYQVLKRERDGFNVVLQLRNRAGVSHDLSLDYLDFRGRESVTEWEFGKLLIAIADRARQA